jgi:hypothetical protein
MHPPELSYLRTKCGLPAVRVVVIPDPDDPASRTLTTAEAATAAHVSENVIAKWKDRGLIVPVDDDAVPRYRELDVLRAEAKTRRAPRVRQLLDEASRIVQ